MTASERYVQIVRVQAKADKSGLFFAESPDLKGLLVAERSMDAVWKAVPKAIQDLYRAVGENVVVTRARDYSDEWYPYAAIPKTLMAALHDEEAAHF